MSKVTELITPATDVQSSAPRTFLSLSRVGVTGIEKVLRVGGGDSDRDPQL